MKGLLLKDFYMVWKHFKIFFLIMLLFTSMSFFGRDNTFFACFSILLMASIPITLLAYDERSGWTKYCGTLPYGTAQIVSEKYLIGLILQAAAMIVSFIVLCVRENFISSQYGISNTITMIAGVFIVSLLIPTVGLPFSLKYGTEKGRMVYYLIIAAIAGVFALGINYAEDYLFSNKSVIYIYATAVPASYVVSWLISISICKNKESGK